MSRYDADDVYCIQGTAVLKNKAGITDQDQLDEYEGDFTAIRLLELTQNPVEGSFDLAHLCKIHQYLFQDVYEWAGELNWACRPPQQTSSSLVMGLHITAGYWASSQERVSRRNSTNSTVRSEVTVVMVAVLICD